MKQFIQKRLQQQAQTGFSIVELLIVIIILGILSGLVIIGYGTLQDKARKNKADTELQSLYDAITTARQSKSGQLPKRLAQITGDVWTGGYCRNINVYQEVHTFPKTHACWVKYYAAIDGIAAASNTNLEDLKDGDPWGAPYYIDENEGEYVGDPMNDYCRLDYIEVFRKDTASLPISTPAAGWFSSTYAIGYVDPQCVSKN